MAPNLPNLGPRARKIVRYGALTLFGIIVFVFALQLSFPYARVKDKLVDSASDKYEITVGGVERGLMPGRVYFKAVTIRTRQTKPEEVINTFYIDKLELDAGILTLLGGNLKLDFDAKIGHGDIVGTVKLAKFGKGDISVNITGKSLPADALPIRAALGLPMTGKLEFAVNLKLPMEKSKLGKPGINWQRAAGGISLACPSGCTFGDGHTKLKPLLKNTRNQVMVGEGIDFGKVNIDSLAAKVSIKSGTLKLDKFDAKSKDGELYIDYEMKLEKSFDESMVSGCLRFKGSDDLMRREPKTHAAISTTGAELRADGLFHIRLTERFKDMKRLNQDCGPNAQNGSGPGTSGGRDRPNLTVQPDDVAKPIPSPPNPTAPPPEPPPATPPAAAPGSAGSANPTGAQPTPNMNGGHEQPAGTSFEPSTGSATGAAPAPATPPPE